MWKASAEKFKDLWQFPNCIAAIDGKHIALQCPIGGGSKYFNYKGFHSVVLLALVDAEYKFIAIDIGAYGKTSDSNIFSTSIIGKKLQNKTLNIARDTPLIENSILMPYVIVGDKAFPFRTYLLRPYSRHHLVGNKEKRIYNYRLSWARRIVENAFGILASRWRVFRRPLDVQPETADKIVLAACCLHNMLCKERKSPDEIELCPRKSALQHLQLRRNVSREATNVRDYFKDYVNSPIGSVPWQLSMIRRGQHAK